MSDFLKTIVAHKHEEVSAAKRKIPLDTIRNEAESMDQKSVFFETLKQTNDGKVNIIAEIKRASPSKGDIMADLNPEELASDYAEAGASAISVLTDNRFFKGSLDDLKAAKKAVDTPVLRKDFTIDAYQIYESKAHQADAVLLITRILEPTQLKDYLALTRELKIDALVEIHSEKDFETATLAGAKLIGINNRNLASFKTDIATSKRLVSLFEPSQTAVAASGINSRKDIDFYLECGINCFLIGESLVRAEDTGGFLKTLISG